MKNTSISERILQVIDYIGVSKNAFAQNIGYERSQALYDIINGKAKPSYDFFDRFINSEYSVNINTEWLITGKGDMLKPKKLKSYMDLDKKSRLSAPSHNQESSMQNDEPKVQNGLIMQLIHENGALREKIGELKKEVDNLNKQLQEK